MDSKVSLILKIVLFAVIAYLGYALYSIIQEPIQFEKLKTERYSATQTRLEQIRDAQKAHRTEYGSFASSFEQLIAFVDTGKQSIVERKDSSFMRYNKTYQQDMNVDTVLIKVLGFTPVKDELFGEGFKPSSLEMIPMANGNKFSMDASKITVNNIILPVFEAKAENTKIFEDVIEKYSQFIDKEYSLTVGSLTEPTLSGNWK